MMGVMTMSNKVLISYTKDGQRFYSENPTNEDIKTAYFAMQKGIISDVVLRCD